MNNDRLPWLLLILCLVTLVGAIIWVTSIVVGFEDEDLKIREKANVREVLFRLDAKANQIIEREFKAFDGLQKGQVPSQVNKITQGFILIENRVYIRYNRNMNIDKPEPLIKKYNESAKKVLLEEEDINDLYLDKVSWLSRSKLYTNYRAFHLDETIVVLQKKGTTYRGLIIDPQSIIDEIIPNSMSVDLLQKVELKKGTWAVSKSLTTLPLNIAHSGLAFQGNDREGLMLIIVWSCLIVPVIGLVILIVAAITLNNRRASFVAAVTHELRTPLTTFRMYTEMLKDGMVPEEKLPDYYDTLENEAERLGHLVENVLNYARLNQGKSKEELKESSLSDIVLRLERELEIRCQRSGMTLIINDESDSKKALMDVAGIERVLVNLIDNG